MTDSTTQPVDDIPSTDLCEDCEREIVGELVKVDGRDEIIHEARQVDEGFMSITAGKATVRFSCACDGVEVEFGPGSTSAWKIPDGWMWEDYND